MVTPLVAKPTLLPHPARFPPAESDRLGERGSQGGQATKQAQVHNTVLRSSHSVCAGRGSQSPCRFRFPAAAAISISARDRASGSSITPAHRGSRPRTTVW